MTLAKAVEAAREACPRCKRKNIALAKIATFYGRIVWGKRDNSSALKAVRKIAKDALE